MFHSTSFFFIRSSHRSSVTDSDHVSRSRSKWNYKSETSKFLCFLLLVDVEKTYAFSDMRISWQIIRLICDWAGNLSSPNANKGGDIKEILKNDSRRITYIDWLAFSQHNDCNNLKNQKKWMHIPQQNR